MHRLRKVSVGVMRRVLVDYDTSGFLEESEWMRLLRVKLVLEKCVGVCTRSDRGMAVPQWALNIEDKAAWRFAVIELAREG